jgi:rhodanese-related sulfurtransferase
MIKYKAAQPFALIDVREPEEIKAFQMIPTAKNIPLGLLSSAMRLDDEEFQQRFGFPKPKYDTKIVCYCRVRRVLLDHVRPRT